MFELKTSIISIVLELIYIFPPVLEKTYDNSLITGFQLISILCHSPFSRLSTAVKSSSLTALSALPFSTKAI